jgi:hypothetical protein
MTSFEPLIRRCALIAVALLATFSSQAATMCTAHSGATSTPVIELYTSEGCSSCPPADRWLSKLPADSSAVALAFHVDYWDRLGWKDRFASAAYTQRQSEQQRVSGTHFSYTPQVIVDGVDRPAWSGTAPGANVRSGASSVDVRLVREGDRVAATIVTASGAPTRLAAYWAVTEDGFVSAVKSGENSGVTLKHDHVVRDYRQVAAWTAKPAVATSLTFDLATPDDVSHPRAVNLVVLDADSGRPIQALKLGC